MHKPVNLSKIRRELDLLQIDLIDELAETIRIRATGTCQVDTAKAVGKYLIMHQHDDHPLQAIVLDRALANICTSE
jgi:hypothetical protein